MEFTESTQLDEIYHAAHLKPIRDSLISGGNFFAENASLSLTQIQDRNPTWFAEDILYGLRRLESPYMVCSVYGGENPRLSAVKLTFLPAREKKHETFVILLAGGAYGAVCTMVESLPVAARLNTLGYNCFCLNYRTAVKEDFVHGLMPQPLDDLAAAWRYICGHAGEFGVDPENYVVSGFSAGGHTASLWGTEKLGARKYGIPQPKCLILGYPLITMDNAPDGPVKKYMCTGMFGADYSSEDIRRYDTKCHIDADYPPVFLVRALDDQTISQKDGDGMKAALGEKCRILQAETGGHGFGLGSATALAGWVEQAAKWMEEL